MAVKFQAARVSLMAVAGAGAVVVSMAAAVPAATAGGAVVSGARLAGAARTGVASVRQAGLADPTPAPVNPAITDATQWTDQVWSGWVDIADKNVALRYVTANFTVPTVTCTSTNQDAYFWVGLDGFSYKTLPVPSNNTVEQAGVAVLCDTTTSSGISPSYHSWWEMYPNGPHFVGTVKPGDVVAVSVYYNGSTGQYSLALNDSNSTAPDFNKSESCPSGYTCHNATAEVIAEDPGGGVANGVYLAKFGTVNFSGVEVTSRNGTHGTLEGNSLWSANEVTMEYGSTVMAQPSDRTDGYTAFSDTWKNHG